MIAVSALGPRRHEAPAGWPVETFERVTDALAAALVASVRRREANADENLKAREAGR